jgi:hypothetical protein
MAHLGKLGIIPDEGVNPINVQFSIPNSHPRRHPPAGGLLGWELRIEN